MSQLSALVSAYDQAAFRTRDLDWLFETGDQRLTALTRLLESWTPETCTAPLSPEDIRDQNLCFRFASDVASCMIAPPPRPCGARSGPPFCLLTDEPAPVARLHPSIKGVWGAQNPGASLVSFNLDAFTSCGHDQGDNAPVSEAATFAYTTALNRFLDMDSGRRIQIGDTSTVFWADARGAQATEAEDLFAGFFDEMTRDAAEETQATAKINDRLAAIREGRELAEVRPNLGAIR